MIFSKSNRFHRYTYTHIFTNFKQFRLIYRQIDQYNSITKNHSKLFVTTRSSCNYDYMLLAFQFINNIVTLRIVTVFDFKDDCKLIRNAYKIQIPN